MEFCFHRSISFAKQQLLAPLQDCKCSFHLYREFSYLCFNLNMGSFCDFVINWVKNKEKNLTTVIYEIGQYVFHTRKAAICRCTSTVCSWVGAEYSQLPF